MIYIRYYLFDTCTMRKMLLKRRSRLECSISRSSTGFSKKHAPAYINAFLIRCQTVFVIQTFGISVLLEEQKKFSESRGHLLRKAAFWFVSPEAMIISIMIAVGILVMTINDTENNNTNNINNNDNKKIVKKSWQAVQGQLYWWLHPDIDCNMWLDPIRRTYTNLTCTEASCMSLILEEVMMWFAKSTIIFSIHRAEFDGAAVDCKQDHVLPTKYTWTTETWYPSQTKSFRRKNYRASQQVGCTTCAHSYYRLACLSWSSHQQT